MTNHQRQSNRAGARGRGRPVAWAGLVLLTLAVCGHAQFVAFWDHVSSPDPAQTHPNTTLGDVSMGVFRYTSTVLRNISNGLPTSVVLHTTNAPVAADYLVIGSEDCSAPAPGTPLYQTFYYAVHGQPIDFSYVYFGPSNVLGIIELTNASVTFNFSGLNPRARYSFKAGAVGPAGINPDLLRRWTRVTITNAAGFIPRMTTNVLTHVHTPDLGPNEVAVNFAWNHTSTTGDLVDWEEINPGPDGSFAVVCTRYTGSVPGGGSSQGRAIVINAMRFEEKIPPQLTIADNHDGTFRVAWTPAVGTLQESTNLLAWTSSSLTNGGSTRLGSPTFFRIHP